MSRPASTEGDRVERSPRTASVVADRPRNDGDAAPHSAGVFTNPCAKAALKSPANVERVRLKLQRHELAAGEVLFREGDRGDCLFVLTRGSVTLAFSLNRDAHRIASFESGVIFGEITMLDGEKRSATAVADRQATVYSLSAAALQELQAADPELVNELLLRVGRHLARRLRVSTDVVSAMADSAN